MNFCIDAIQLRKALVAIEMAEKNGFNFCLAVMRISSCGRMLDQNLLEYSDLIEKAHPTNGNYAWGRFQGVSRRNKFVKGKLVPIKQEKTKGE